jgi:hypothetical protein
LAKIKPDIRLSFTAARVVFMEDAMENQTTKTDMKTLTGGCHCGAVRYRVELDLAQPAGRCNCTICTKSAAAGRIVKPEAFELLAGEAALFDYHREGSPVHHPFCMKCGIRSFGHGDLPELGGKYYSINVNCLDEVDPARLEYVYWDGRHNNWEAGARKEPWPVHAS